MVRPFGKLRTHHQRILLDFAIVLARCLPTPGNGGGNGGYSMIYYCETIAQMQSGE